MALRDVCSRCLGLRCLASVAAALLVVPAVVAAQQTAVIAGRVTAAGTDAPLVTAQVFLEGAGIGALTDRDGVFRIENVPAGEHRLVASFLGYGRQDRTITVLPGQVLDESFALAEQAITLDELVVTSYQVRARRDRTGALTQLARSDIEAMPIQTPDQALQGRSPGVNVSANTGQPGSGMRVRVRGEGSIDAGNEPLYIIDGVQISTRQTAGQVDTSPLAGLDPRDIESIEILKDAAAASIYGAQAANGVVLITTRRGQAGATQFTVAAETGISEPVEVWDVVSGPDWVRLQMEAQANRSRDTGQPPEAGEQLAIELFGHPDEVGHYDWQRAIRRSSAQSRRFSASASGGSEETRFFLSGSLDRQQAPLVGSDFERMSFRANLDHRATERLSLLVNVGLSEIGQEGDIDGNCQNCPFWAAPHMRPIVPIWNEDGSYNQNIAPIPYNIAFQVFEQPQLVKVRHAVGGFTMNYAIRPRLNFRSFWGLDLRTRRETQYRPPEQQVIGDNLVEVYRDFVNWNTNQVLNHDLSLGSGHNLSSLVGVEYRHERFELIQAVGSGFPSGLFQTLDLAAVPLQIAGRTGGFKLASGFANMRYDYLNRFMLSGSLRYDGSSRFGSNFRWGLFYSGSAGWDLAQESFVQQRAGFFDDLTLRVSYGIAGNAAIGDFASLTLFGLGLPGVTGITGNSYMGRAGLRPSQLGNDLLTWEEAKSTNLGLTWSVLAGRLYGSLDLFRTNNEKLLLDAFLPIDAGFNSVVQNSGVVRNQGIELETGSVPIERGRFSWRSDFNITYLENEIIELVGDLENIGNTTRVGHPLRIYWGPRWAGVNAADGRPMWYDADGNITYTPGAADDQVLGSRVPKYEGGWNNSFRFGPLSMDVLFQYVLGVDAQDTQQNNLIDIASTRGLSTKALERWQQPGDITSVPRAYTSTAQPGTASYTMLSSRYIFDASYVRLRNVSIGYQLPARLAAAVNAASARLYAQGRNLKTWTAFPGLDPEVMIADHMTFPNSRQLVTGVQIQF